MEKRYYQKEIETMPVEDIKKLQSEKLVKQVKHVYENVPYYKKLMDESAAVANYTNEIMATRFTDVMWLMEQIMWKSFDKRLAGFLLEESTLENSLCLKMTHERIAGHLGTAREVVTRMLRYFQSEGMVRLSRGEISITDEKALRKLAE